MFRLQDLQCGSSTTPPTVGHSKPKIFEKFSKIKRIAAIPIPKSKTPKAVKTEPNPSGFPLDGNFD